MKKIIIGICTVVLALCGYFFLKIRNSTPSRKNMTLIAEETASPNKDYVSNEEDVVYYTVSVYQDRHNKIHIFADSNSAHYGNISYEVDCNHSIDRSNVQVKWTTLMGSTEPSENDELACAEVTITEDEKTISKERINFLSKVIKAITDTFQ